MNIKQEAKRDLISQITGVLSALLPVLAILGISQEWFTQDFISSLNVFLVSLAPLVVNIYTIIKNHYFSEKARKQNAMLKQKGLK